MSQSIYPAVFPTRRCITLISGTSWTVPERVLYVNVTLYGGGGAGGGTSAAGFTPGSGSPGQVIRSLVNTTPGASITYAIGAGGTGANGVGGTGGTTTFTGATDATGGVGGASQDTAGATGSQAGIQYNQGGTAGSRYASRAGGNGGAGMIEIEYWA